MCLKIGCLAQKVVVEGLLGEVNSNSRVSNNSNRVNSNGRLGLNR